MADDESADRGEAADRPQDPLVDRLRPDPSEPPKPSRTLEGVLGDSDRPGHRRLYFTPELDSYAEFRAEDVLSVADIPPDQPPFLGEQATRVTLRRDAAVDFTRTQQARPLDEFDLDVRLARGAGVAGDRPLTFGEPGCLETFGFGCQEGGGLGTFDCGIFTEACTIVRCPTVHRTCLTCRTACDTCSPTCVTCATCLTCGRTCGPTCARTCVTCNQLCRPTRLTCPTGCQNTCGPACFSPTQICEVGP